MKVAVVSAKGLGDGLICKVLSHNFSKSGHQVTTFSSPLSQLRRWFEGSVIHPHPTPEKCETLFNTFDLVIAQDHSCLAHLKGKTEKLFVADQDVLHKKESLVKNFARLCKEHFSLPYFEENNGITPPPELTFQMQRNRVVLHPFSTSPEREWPLANFIQLAKELKKRGLDVAFTTSVKERARLLQMAPCAAQYELPSFDSLDEMASYLYESGSLIGNNSGPGHLASNFGLPTYSLFARKSYAKLWRPAFTYGKVITPLPFAFGARQKEKSLQTLLSPSRVLAHFIKG